MKRKTTAVVSVLGALLLGAAAIAQTISIPQVTTIGATDLIQIIPSGTPRAGNVYAPAPLVTSQKGYYHSAPLTGFRLTAGNSQTMISFKPAGTLASGYVTFAPSPSDGNETCIFSTQIITLLYPTANTGQTVDSAVTTLAANARVCYEWAALDATWWRTM